MTYATRFGIVDTTAGALTGTYTALDWVSVQASSEIFMYPFQPDTHEPVDRGSTTEDPEPEAVH